MRGIAEPAKAVADGEGDLDPTLKHAPASVRNERLDTCGSPVTPAASVHRSHTVVAGVQVTGTSASVAATNALRSTDRLDRSVQSCYAAH
jgi:hypothetical protein